MERKTYPLPATPDAGSESAWADRHALALEAVWEIDALARCLPDLVSREDTPTHLRVRGVAGRIVRMAGVLMDALHDEAVSNEELRRRVELTACGNG